MLVVTWTEAPWIALLHPCSVLPYSPLQGCSHCVYRNVGSISKHFGLVGGEYSSSQHHHPRHPQDFYQWAQYSNMNIKYFIMCMNNNSWSYTNMMYIRCMNNLLIVILFSNIFYILNNLKQVTVQHLSIIFPKFL